MRRDALRMGNQEFTIRKAGAWNSTPTAVQDRAYDTLDEERRKTGYKGNAYDRGALRNWLIKTGRLTADWDEVFDRDYAEFWAGKDRKFLRLMGDCAMAVPNKQRARRRLWLNDGSCVRIPMGDG
jgi:hypothetical protein